MLTSMNWPVAISGHEKRLHVIKISVSPEKKEIRFLFKLFLRAENVP